MDRTEDKRRLYVSIFVWFLHTFLGNIKHSEDTLVFYTPLPSVDEGEARRRRRRRVLLRCFQV